MGYEVVIHDSTGHDRTRSVLILFKCDHTAGCQNHLLQLLPGSSDRSDPSPELALDVAIFHIFAYPLEKVWRHMLPLNAMSNFFPKMTASFLISPFMQAMCLN